MVGRRTMFGPGQGTARRARAGAAALALLLASAACTPVTTVHGYAPQPEALATVLPGVDDRASVTQKIGRPGMAGVFAEDGWYYVSSTVERMTYHAPEVVDRRVVAVTFDENDIVASIGEYGMEDGRVIDLQSRTTPTQGRQLTILQQILGNIGVFTAGDFLSP